MRPLLAFLAVAATLAGCGSVAATNGSDAGGGRPSGGDDASSSDALTTVDSRGPDAMPADATSDATLARCGTSTYTTAPNGGACDPTRIQVATPEGAECYAPPTGAWCDVLQFSFTTGDQAAVPAGFSCSPSTGGTTLCDSSSFAGNSHIIDDATLNDLCTITRTFTQSVITCGIF
jgi:hypothetical protein